MNCNLLNIKNKRRLMITVLALGILWDVLCLTEIVKPGYFFLSAIAVGGYSLMLVTAPLLFPLLPCCGEKSTHYSQLKKGKSVCRHYYFSHGSVGDYADSLHLLSRLKAYMQIFEMIH